MVPCGQWDVAIAYDGLIAVALLIVVSKEKRIILLDRAAHVHDKVVIDVVGHRVGESIPGIHGVRVVLVKPHAVKLVRPGLGDGEKVRRAFVLGRGVDGEVVDFRDGVQIR